LFLYFQPALQHKKKGGVVFVQFTKTLLSLINLIYGNEEKLSMFPRVSLILVSLAT
jgi:hypothetical protein